MIKLVVTDLDGTIAKVGSSKLENKYYEAIRKLKDLGIVFVVASGRQPDSIMKVFRPVIEDIYIISNNGASTQLNGKSLYSYDIDLDLIKEFTPKLRAIPNCQMMLTGDTGYYFDDATDDFKKFILGYGFGIEKFESYDKLSHINKICVYNNTDTPHPALSYDKKYENLITYIAGDGWIDFVDKRASKGNSVQLIQRKLGIKTDETMVFGDQQNDISMFAFAKYNFAVSNASQEALEAADNVIPSWKEDGVLQIWNKLIKQKGEFDD